MIKTRLTILFDVSWCREFLLYPVLRHPVSSWDVADEIPHNGFPQTRELPNTKFGASHYYTKITSQMETHYRGGCIYNRLSCVLQ